jgi:hypothetical protein
MEIKRFANNETFIQNIIRSIDSNENNYRRNYIAFNKYFNEKMDETNNPVLAIEFAKEKLAEVVKRRNARDEVKEEKGIVKEPTLNDLQKETSAINAERKEKRRQEIMSLIKAKSGYEDEETLKLLYKKFVGSKRANNLSDVSTVDRVVHQYKEYLAKKAPPEEPEAPAAPPTEEEKAKARRIIEHLDPKNRTQNLEMFRRYLLKYNINDAFHYIQDLIKYRQFLKLNGLPSNATTIRIFETYGENLEKAKEMVIKWQREKSMPMESEVLDKSKGVKSKFNDVLVDYNGEKAPLHRIIQKVYNGLPLNLVKKSYATVKQKVFHDGLSIDEAIAFNNRELDIINRKVMFKQQFPEDPEQAMMIFESYYIDEGMSFEEALERTKQEIYGNRRTSAKYKIRIK